ncbi:MAG: hypothetical protein HPM95_13430 [Alphaproteobacteria bacterium]|nr:hypothetical protein [Alphaproteobacteria bacterium]
MTGTVLDGNIDIAALRSDGETIAEFGPWRFAPYPADLKPLLQETLRVAADWGSRAGAGDLPQGGGAGDAGAERGRRRLPGRFPV